MRLYPLILTVLAVLFGTATLSHAQDVTEVTLKGAFIFNFAKFTEWPSDALTSSSTMTACAVGDSAVGAALDRAVAAAGNRLNGRALRVLSLAPDDASLAQCQMLYVSGLSRSRTVNVLSRLRDTPVLTVGDEQTFLKAGGIIQIIIENGKMRFRINVRSVKRARLQLSSKLLALADLVDEDPEPRAPVRPTGPGLRHE